MENINKLEIVPGEEYEIGADKAPVIPEWSVKDDETLRQKVDDLAHSTFDKSKFTVVGSPTITDDGVASGFGSGNYIKCPFDIGAKTWKLKFIVNPSALPSGNTGFFGRNGSLSFGINIGATNILQVVLSSDGTNADIGDLSANTALTLNANNEVEIGWNGTQYYIIINNGTPVTLDSTTPIYNSNEILNLGTNRSVSSFYADGSIDLKQFSITVDGVEVFSGNKTGIDTISKNYIEQNSPTISEEGILSFANSSNYIYSDKNLDLTGDWEYIVPVNLKADSLTTACQLLYTSSPVSLLEINSNLKVYFYITGSPSSISYTTTGSVPLGKGFLKFSHSGVTYKIEYSTDKTNWTIIGVITDASNPTANSPILIGGGYSTLAIDSNEIDIDLSGIQFIKNSGLAYRPCLIIPYTESKTGSKIVNSIYRDRVKDLFEQEGYNIYYTLGDDDFTLPSNKPNDIVKYKANGLTVAEQRADQTLTIRGACESGTDVNLPMDFFDGDSYTVFGVGTTGTNTASKFTPDADGNYIAIGKGKV